MKIHILAILVSGPAAGVMLTVLRDAVAVRARRRIGDAEWDSELARLEREGLITRGTEAAPLVDDITGDPMAKLTPKGRKAADRIG